MKRQISVFKGVKLVKVLSAIFGCVSILGSASAASATAFTLDELNFHIEKCYESTIAEPVSTRYCDRLLKNRIKPREVEANALYNRGVIHFQLQDLDNAKADFAAVLKLTPNLYQAHIALGEIAIAQQNYSKALEHYDVVIAQNGMSKALNQKRDGIVKKLELAGL